PLTAPTQPLNSSAPIRLPYFLPQPTPTQRHFSVSHLSVLLLRSLRYLLFKPLRANCCHSCLLLHLRSLCYLLFKASGSIFSRAFLASLLTAGSSFVSSACNA